MTRDEQRPEPEMRIPESTLQSILTVEDLPGTPSESRAIDAAYKAGWDDALTTAISELYGVNIDITLKLSERLAKKMTTLSEGDPK